jgi:hypothetical protein
MLSQPDGPYVMAAADDAAYVSGDGSPEPMEAEMPITKRQVLSLLNDPDLAKIKFSVGPIVVTAAEFSNLADYFEDDDIKVVPGAQAHHAKYERDLKQLQVDAKVTSLPTIEERALILHECVHAIVDVRGLRVPVLTDEVAAYTAQVMYIQIKDPGPHLPAVKIPASRPLTAFIASVLDMIDQYKLMERAARISEFDIFALSLKLRAVPEYAEFAVDDMESDPTGVPINGRGIQALRMALRAAHRPVPFAPPQPPPTRRPAAAKIYTF